MVTTNPEVPAHNVPVQPGAARSTKKPTLLCTGVTASLVRGHQLAPSQGDFTLLYPPLFCTGVTASLLLAANCLPTGVFDLCATLVVGSLHWCNNFIGSPAFAPDDASIPCVFWVFLALLSPSGPEC